MQTYETAQNGTRIFISGIGIWAVLFAFIYLIG